MAEITVTANLPCLGMERNQTATVELTPMIQGALRNGYLSEAVSDHLVEILTGVDPNTEVPTEPISEKLAEALDVPAAPAPKRRPRG